MRVVRTLPLALRACAFAMCAVIGALDASSARADDGDDGDDDDSVDAAAGEQAQADDGATAAGDEDDDTPAVVSWLPLLGEGSVTSKQARGVTVQLRDALTGVPVRLLPTTKDDDKALRRCSSTKGTGAARLDVACLGDLARERGATRLIAGVVSPADEGGLLISLVVVVPGGVRARAQPHAVLHGDAWDAQVREHLVLQACAPTRLRGTLVVDGDPAASLTLDGRLRGALPLQIADVREGEHELVVTRPGFDAMTRTLGVKHNETTTFKAVLIPSSGTGNIGVQQQAFDPTPSIAAIATGSVLVVGGGVAGTFSLLDSLEIESRAQRKQLEFPRDSVLFARGGTLATVANVLYGVGLVAIGGGATVWALHESSTRDDSSGSVDDEPRAAEAP